MKKLQTRDKQEITASELHFSFWSKRRDFLACLFSLIRGLILQSLSIQFPYAQERLEWSLDACVIFQANSMQKKEELVSQIGKEMVSFCCIVNHTSVQHVTGRVFKGHWVPSMQNKSLWSVWNRSLRWLPQTANGEKQIICNKSQQKNRDSDPLLCFSLGSGGLTWKDPLQATLAVPVWVHSRQKTYQKGEDRYAT